MRQGWLVGWRLLNFAVVAISLVWARPARAELDWDPSRTWVFAVGVLHWQHPDMWRGMANAEQNRRDVELVEYFHKSGIPRERIVHLRDERATRQLIDHELKSLLAHTRADDLLVFYFTGHGFRDHSKHDVHFANFDAVDGPSAWPVKSIYDTLESHFRGNRVLLLADCCYSGGLVDEARLRKTRLGYACLCSSYSHNSSTGQWTFTDSVLAGLRGSPKVDLNADGEIDFSELAQFSELEMAFVEGQKAVYSQNHAFPDRWRIAAPTRRRTARQGERVEVMWKDKWYRAEILQSSGDQCQVHYVGFADSWNEWVGPNRIRQFVPRQIAQGTPIEVKWRKDNKWYPANVVRSWYGLTFVHYDGYPTEWDEWVNFDSIRATKN